MRSHRPRELSFPGHPTVTVYTDAMGEGNCASVAFHPGGTARCMYHTHLPAWLRNDPTVGIFEYEMCGVALGALAVVQFAPGTPILVRCDDAGAKGTVIRGMFVTRVVKLLSSLIWRVAAEAAAQIWIEYVKSDHNAADAPSRCCGGAAHTNEFADGIAPSPIPERFADALASLENLESYGLNTTNRTACHEWKRP